MQRLIRAAIVVTLPVVIATSHGGKTKSSSTVVEVKGEWADCNTLAEKKQDGDDQLITVTITETFTGTLKGSYEGIERVAVHKDGSGSFHGSGTFSGEIDGRSGTATMTYSGTTNSNGLAVAHWVLDQGTEGLSRLDGHGTFEGKEVKPPPAGCTDAASQSVRSGTYSGVVEMPGR